MSEAVDRVRTTVDRVGKAVRGRREAGRDLSGLVVAVTGGGRGIGEATARALAARGCRVAVGDRDVAAARSVADELGAPALGLPLDVTRRESVEDFLDEVEAGLGPLDVLVNNAGIMLLSSQLEESDAAFEAQVAVNLRGVALGTRSALRRMAPRGRGHVVNVASSAGKVALAGGATYCATKHAVVGYSAAVREEVRSVGLEISCVMPAIVTTDLAGGMSPTRGIPPLSAQDVAEQVVSAVRRPRFGVYVPRGIGPLLGVTGALPTRARDAVARAFGADRTMVELDREARRDYEERALG